MTFIVTSYSRMAIICRLILFFRPISALVARAATGRRISNGRARQRAQKALPSPATIPTRRLARASGTGWW
jgi:hypothetical protein